MVAAAHRGGRGRQGADVPRRAHGGKGRLGDGACDAALNNAGCGFDLGDCCASTSTGRGPFESCADPAEVEFDAACGASNAIRIGDGRCDPALNTEACIYDGGDCCRWSCARRDCADSKPSEARCRRMGINAADNDPTCVCDSKKRMHRGPSGERYFSAILWPPVASSVVLTEHARRMIDKEVDVVQWSRFDPAANFSSFLYEIYGFDRTLQNWTWIGIKRDLRRRTRPRRRRSSRSSAPRADALEGREAMMASAAPPQDPDPAALGPRIPGFVRRDAGRRVYDDPVYQTRDAAGRAAYLQLHSSHTLKIPNSFPPPVPPALWVAPALSSRASSSPDSSKVAMPGPVARPPTCSPPMKTWGSDD